MRNLLFAALLSGILACADGSNRGMDPGGAGEVPGDSLAAETDVPDAPGTDPARDAASDGPADTTLDAPRDTVPDPSADAHVDAVTDVATDATGDTLADTTPDASRDLLPDPAADAHVDVVTDAATDAAGDAATDAVTDAATDAAGDTLADTTPDASRDLLPDPAADAPADAPSEFPLDALSDAQNPGGPVRFAVVSDTHLWADDMVQNNVNWIIAATRLAAMDPPLDRVFATGDDIDDLFSAPFALQEWLDGIGDPPPVLLTQRRLVDTYLPATYRIVLGNHDNRYFDTFEGNALPLAAWAKAFDGSPACPAPWYAEEIRGCRFVVLQSTELATNHEDNDLPTFGAGQLAWLEQQVSTDLPVVIFWHHWIEKPADGQAPLPVMQILQQQAGPAERVVFTGHGHAFHRYVWQGLRVYETGALKESPDWVHQVECDGETGRITVVNEADLPYVEGSDPPRPGAPPGLTN